MKNDCQYMADTADELAADANTPLGFVNDFKTRFVPPTNQDSPEMREFRSDGFKRKFRDDGPYASYNQVRHFAGGFSNGYLGALGAMALNPAAPAEAIAAIAISIANRREGPNEPGDRALNGVAVKMGVDLAYGRLNKKDIGSKIRQQVCGPDRQKGAP